MMLSRLHFAHKRTKVQLNAHTNCTEKCLFAFFFSVFPVHLLCVSMSSTPEIIVATFSRKKKHQARLR